MAHEFAALLQFSTTFEVMEFSAGQQITLSQRMEEEHVEMQSIQRALACTATREDERALGKIGRGWNADEGRIGIELPPLNTTLVEFHRELATVRNGAKDTVTKNKRLRSNYKLDRRNPTQTATMRLQDVTRTRKASQSETTNSEVRIPDRSQIGQDR